MEYIYRLFPTLLDEAKLCVSKKLPAFCDPSFDILMAKKTDDYRSQYGLNLTNCNGKTLFSTYSPKISDILVFDHICLNVSTSRWLPGVGVSKITG